MPLSGTVEHATPADGTFSTAGALAWDGTGAHTVTLTGSASVAQGGTGLATIAQASILGANAADTLTAVVLAAGQSIRWNAGGTAFEAYTPAASGASLNGITAATGAVTIASGNNTGIVWNWANTTNTTVAFTFGETSAATNGTITTGIANQVLLKALTVAGSTQSPFQVFSRGTFAFGIHSTTQQTIHAVGTAAAPQIVCSADLTTGISFVSGAVNLSQGGALVLQTSPAAVGIVQGTASLPGLLDFTAGANGLFWTSTSLNIATGSSYNASRKLVTFDSSANITVFKGSADAVSNDFAFRKSRGTVASPTVITTGDDLATISGFGYVGATNTFQEACRITFDSTGTIADTATGIGGIIAFAHATVGAEPVTVAKLKSQHLIHSGTAPTITAGGGTDPTIVGSDESFCITIGTGGIATTVEVTFGNAFTTNAPSVGVESDTDIVPFKITPLTNKVTITATLAFTAGSKLYCIARGWE